MDLFGPFSTILGFIAVYMGGRFASRSRRFRIRGPVTGRVKRQR